jgi:nucleotide-binding universal stress UspA family protein
MKILVPTDFSDNAANAIRYAVSFARATHSDIVLLNVYTPAVTRNNMAYATVQDEIGMATQLAHDRLTQRCRDIAYEDGVSCSYRVAVGMVVEEIVNLAKAEDVHFILMGTKGASGVERVLFGSNTASVLERAHCPVLAVPAQVEPVVPKKIVYATNYLDSDLEILHGLTTLCTMTGAELLMLHVAEEHQKIEADFIERFSKIVSAETRFRELFYYVLSHHDIQEGIQQFVDSVNADLLVMSTRKRTLLERLYDPSITKKLVYQLKLPLLAFHAGKS